MFARGLMTANIKSTPFPAKAEKGTDRGYRFGHQEH
jgi:hypothetical protein